MASSNPQQLQLQCELVTVTVDQAARSYKSAKIAARPHIYYLRPIHVSIELLLYSLLPHFLGV